jgi:uncharacterized repeat protein (TIGR03803 family)
MKKIITLLAITFCSNLNAQYTKLHDFTSATNGTNPYASLVSDGTFLYGTTFAGGVNGMGTIFKIMPNGTGYAKLLDFAGATNGDSPSGSLIYDGTYLYGTTSVGGTNNFGTLFKIKPNGTGFVKLLDFSGTTNGNQPEGDLYYDGTFLYGMTEAGGISSNCASGCGVIFKIKPDGTGYLKLLDFDRLTNGGLPFGSLISDGTFLYGTTSVGGTNNLGTIFKIMPNGTGYTKLLDFAGAANGSSPYGSLISDGTFLYGMTNSGGTNSMGTVFKIMPNGTGFVKLLDFAGTTNGSTPWGNLYYNGTFLYGMTGNGGANNMGVIFKIKTDGSSYADLLDFAGTTNGNHPSGSLFSDGTFLYGVTYGGGVGNNGTVFKLGGALSEVTEINIANEVVIYPNPASTILNLALRQAQGDKAELTITDLLGNVVKHQTIETEKTTIDLTEFGNGVYFVSVKTNEGIITKKVVVNK